MRGPPRIPQHHPSWPLRAHASPPWATIGDQTFSQIRQQNPYYIDKTHFACQLFRQGKHYSLSQPRRFGKSLFVSTLKALFEGRPDLFQGWAAYDQWPATLPGEVETTVGERLLRLE